MSVAAHGEIQLRAEHDSQLPLTPPLGDPALGVLGQRTFATEWIRVGSELTRGKALRLRVELDLIPRWILGDVARGVSEGGDYARDTAVPSVAQLREAFLDWRSSVGLLRVGQVAAHWGLGLVTNDGDHPMLFGDYQGGTLVERIGFAARPAGDRSPILLTAAAELVAQDPQTSWARGDRTYQVVASASWVRDARARFGLASSASDFRSGHSEQDEPGTRAGLYLSRRWQNISGGATQNVISSGTFINTYTVDGSGTVSFPISGDDAKGFLGVEVASIFGDTDAARTVSAPNRQTIREFGGAGQIGLSHGHDFARLAVQVEYGWTSGDADPYDDELRRFTFDPNHRVGLVLFPFVLHYQTARAATNLGDRLFSGRAMPASRLLPSRGGVFGAQYLNPTIVVRPIAQLELKAGLVVATSTSDVVDPYRTAISGSPRSYLGADSRARDLGVELDFGCDARIPLREVALQLGVQWGVLFPGHAFDDSTGAALGPQAVVVARSGLQF